MREKNPAAVALGSMTSERKARAARENGRKGGRPRLIPCPNGCPKWLVRFGRGLYKCEECGEEVKV